LNITKTDIGKQVPVLKIMPESSSSDAQSISSVTQSSSSVTHQNALQTSLTLLRRAFSEGVLPLLSLRGIFSSLKTPFKNQNRRSNSSPKPLKLSHKKQARPKGRGRVKKVF